MAVEMFRVQSRADMIHVPYKGSGPAMTDLVGGQVLMAAETVPAALQQVKAGKLRALAVTTPQRISMLPRRADGRPNPAGRTSTWCPPSG
jgi:tripartite-type tricarboxylate transporter receptor subunit TctC